jgi:diguanylate cyclase (GGDEF)-like protein
MERLKDREAAFEGRRIKSKIFLALTLTSIIPLLILTYLLHIHVIPLLDANTHRLLISSLQGLLVCTALLMAGGGYVRWDIASAVVRTAQMVAKVSKTSGVEGRCDEIGMLMASFSRMLTTIEDQATQINMFAAHLESAYKDLEAAHSRLKEFSVKDEVPELYNRRFFFFRLEEEIRRYRRFGHPLSLVILALDGFKGVNDQLGQTAGDETLKEVVQLMVKHSHADDSIAQRGVNAFAILLANTPKSGALGYAERIRQALADCTFSDERQLIASFGIASLPEDIVASSEELINAADKALYEAKHGSQDTIMRHPPEAVRGSTLGS